MTSNRKSEPPKEKPNESGSGEDRLSWLPRNPIADARRKSMDALRLSVELLRNPATLLKLPVDVAKKQIDTLNRQVDALRRLENSKWRRILFALLLLLMTPPMSVSVLFYTAWGRERLRDAAEEIIERELNLDAQLGPFEVQTFPRPVFYAKDIRLLHRHWGTVIQASQLSIRPSMLSMMRGQVDLREVVISEPKLNLVVRDGEVVNFPSTRTSGTEHTGDYPFSRIKLERAEVAIDGLPNFRMSLNNVSLELLGEGHTLRGHVSGRGDGRYERMSESLEHFDATFTLAPEEFAIDSASLHTKPLAISVKNGVIQREAPHAFSGQIQGRYDLAHAERLPVEAELPLMTGELQVDLAVSGDQSEPAAKGMVLVSHGVVDDLGLGDRVELNIDINREKMLIEGGSFIDVIDGGGRLNLTGAIDLDTEEGLPLAVKADVDGLRFEKLMHQLDVTPNTIVQWLIDGHLDFSGRLVPFALEGPIAIRSRDFLVTQQAYHVPNAARVIGAKRAQGTGRMRIDLDGLSFSQIDLRLPDSRLKGDAYLSFDDEIRVHAEGQMNLADASPLAEFELGGKGRITVDVTGNYDNAKVNGAFDVKDFAFATFRVGDVKSPFALEKGGVAVRMPSVSTRKGGSVYRADNLFVDFSDSRFLISAQMEAERLTLEDFYHTFHFEKDERFTPYQGEASGSVAVKYTRDFPGDGPNGTMVADLDLSVHKASLNDIGFEDGQVRGTFKWLDYTRSYEGGELDIDHAHLRKGEGVVTLSGKMGLGGALRMEVAADRLAIEDLEPMAESRPELRGYYNVIGSIGGRVEMPRMHLNLRATGLTWHNTPIGDARAYVRMTDKTDPYVRAAADWNGQVPEGEACGYARAGFHDGRWAPDPPLQTVDGPKPRLLRPVAFLICGDGLHGQVKVDMMAGRTEVYPLRGKISFADLDLAPFIKPFSGPVPAQGRFSGDFMMTDGALLTDMSMSGSVAVRHLRIERGGRNAKSRPLYLEVPEPTTLTLQSGVVHFDNAMLRGPQSQLRATGKASREQLGLAIDGSADLGLLAETSDAIKQADGEIKLRVNLTGAISNPAIYGRADVRNGSFEYSDFPRFEDFSGRIRFSAQRVLFENFRANVAGGRLGLSGSANLRAGQLDRYELDIKTEGVSFTPESGIEVSASSATQLSWDRQQRLPLLRGTVDLERMQYTQPIRMGRTLQDMSRSERIEVDRYNPEEDRIELDIRVRNKTPIRVENNLVDADVRIADTETPFRIVGTDQRFGVLGKVAVNRGVIRFRGSEFQIRRGVVEFDDETRINPNFDLRADTEIRRREELSGSNWTITLHAHGNRDSFQLDTFSEPELSDEDIVLLLTVGMTRAEAEQLQAGDLTSTAALEALATVTGLDREVKRALPVIDDFSLASQYSPRTNRTELQVSVGKRVSKDVRVGAASGLGEERDVSASLEWQLGEQTSLQAVYDNYNTATSSSVGNVGVDVRWRLEFE